MAPVNGFPIVSNLNTRCLFEATNTTDKCINWLRGLGLIARNKSCPHCAADMKEMNDRKRMDGKRWRCTVKACSKECSIREGSFFGGGSKLQLKVIIDILYWYAYEEASMKALKRECGLATEAIVNWKNYIREIFAEYFLLYPLQIGGPGRVVEIGESVFSRRKHNVGRVVKTQWVFGGIDVASKEGFLVAVDQKDAETLLPILQQYVRPGTTLISELWAAYNTVANPGYQDLTVNHSIQFLSTVNAATTNHIEAMWCRAKLRNEKECGTAQTLLNTYMIEFMWRMQFGEDPFENLVSCIREVYPV